MCGKVLTHLFLSVDEINNNKQYVPQAIKDVSILVIAENKNGIEYYQVSLTTREEKTLERELRPLQKTGDFYPKYLLTMDRDLEADYEGIKKINAIDWLLDINI